MEFRRMNPTIAPAVLVVAVLCLAFLPIAAGSVAQASVAAQDATADAPMLALAAPASTRGEFAGQTALPGVQTVAAGGQHTCALTTGGGVICWGNNDYGQLGDSTTIRRLKPVAVRGLSSGVQAVAAGENHTCAVTISGAVKCWGQGSGGQLGDGTTARRLTLVDVSGLSSGVRAIAAGGGHTCALTAAGGVKCWGWNQYGQLGDGTTERRLTPVDVSGLSSGVQALTAGYAHTCARTSSNRAQCWGWNRDGQLGDGTTTDRLMPADVKTVGNKVENIAAGAMHTCAATPEWGGVTLWCWGANASGQLGNGARTASSDPFPVTGHGTAYGTLWQPTAGMRHTCGLVSGGIKCWGASDLGQRGDGTTADSLTPADVSGLTSGAMVVAAGASHTCAVTASRGVKCWGSNFSGQLGDGTTADSLTPVDVGGLMRGVVAIAAGGLGEMGIRPHTCALMSSGRVQCWGANYDGQLGDGTNESRYVPVTVSGLASGVVAVAAGVMHTCALTAAGGVLCWGANIGITPVAVTGLANGVSAIGAFGWHSCAAMDAGHGGGVQCWGRNDVGQLGDGTTTDRTAPAAVHGLGSSVIALVGGTLHTCALKNDGEILCWGWNFAGQIGDGTTTNRATPVAVSGLTGGVSAIAAGEVHTCAVNERGGVLCWGYNSNGQLGDGTTSGRATPVAVSGLASGVVAIAAGDRHTCALTAAGGVLCWGGNFAGQLGDGTTDDHLAPVPVSGLTSGVVAIAAGEYYSCAVVDVDDQGVAYCWGSNTGGQLGDGTTIGRLMPVRVMTYKLSMYLPLLTR